MKKGENATSIVNEEFEFNEEVWVVTLLNTGTGLGGKFTGHSVLLFEGVYKGELFVRQCDIQAMPTEESILGEPFKNVRGAITNIRMFPSYYEERHRYKEMSSRSWYRSKEQVAAMLEVAKADKEQTEKAKRGEAEYLAYQYAGRYRFDFFGEKDNTGDEVADNCPTWCYKILRAGGIELRKLPFDYIKAMPQKHVKSGAEFLENVFNFDFLNHEVVECEIIEVDKKENAVNVETTDGTLGYNRCLLF
jgi:hypothetical protein